MTIVPREWAVSASVLILVVMLLRRLLGNRISAQLRYGLWSVVLVRLLLPVSVFLAVTVPQLPSWTPPETMQEKSIYVLPVDIAPLENSGVHVQADGTLGDANSFGYPQLSRDGEHVVRYADKISPLDLLGILWIAGAFIFGAVLLAANLRFFIRLRRVRHPLEGMNTPVPVYIASALPSPCLVGLLKPSVYVTEEAAADPIMLRHVLVHELTHYNHRDHLWSVLRGLALAMHWWNPLVWLAVIYSRRDGELACDEGALERLGDSERTAYGETLLSLVTAKGSPSDLLNFATTMTGGKKSLRERIQRISCQPKQLVSAVIAVSLTLILAVLVTFGQAGEAKASNIHERLNNEAPETPTSRPAGAWGNAQITLSEDGIPHIDYSYGNTMEFLDGEPIPAPREWAGQDFAGRNEATTLAYSPAVWAKLVSPNDGWLVACYGQGMAKADTYVYKTADGGMTWTEVSMPGTNWHISDVGFLSADRLILGQRLMIDAPCYITRDGGENWEKISLPDRMASAIRFDGNRLTLYVTPSETEPPTYTMTSQDLGDTWLTEELNLSQGIETDLNHDGVPDTLRWRKYFDETAIETWTLQAYFGNKAYPSWEEEAYTAHVGWMALLLCSLEGEDYLLKYTPWMGGGECEYRYELFYLTPDGREVVVQENSVEFDVIFSPDYADRHQFEPKAIASFMGEINALLENSILLVNTDQNLQATFAQEGRLYDNLWWLDMRDENLSILGNLENYARYAQDHPDDTWSSLEDIMQSLTAKDIIGLPNEDNAVLAHCLRSAERGSRFYTWDSYEDAYSGHFDSGEGASWYMMKFTLTDGSTLHLFTKDQGESSVLLILETQDEAVSAYYDMPELEDYVKSVTLKTN